MFSFAIWKVYSGSLKVTRDGEWIYVLRKENIMPNSCCKANSSP